MNFNKALFLISFIYAGLFLSGCSSNNTAIPDGEYIGVSEFSDELNAQLEEFLMSTQSLDQRKVAIVDFDGTMFGQVPHYLADECIFGYADNNPGYKDSLVAEMTLQAKMSTAYFENRIRFFEGMTLEEIANIGIDCHLNWYPTKFYPHMLQLVENLKRFEFEIWIITTSPEGLYQGFAAQKLDISTDRVIGTKATVENGVATDEIVYPLSQEGGKAELIDIIINTSPLFVAGNSTGDFEMIEESTGFKMVVNPNDTKLVEKLGGITLKQYAVNNGWAIVHAMDVSEPEFPDPSYSSEHGTPTNTPNP